MDPKLLEEVKVMGSIERWINEPIEAVLIHELGHAYGIRDFLVEDFQPVGGVGATDQYSVDREDEYRTLVGLPLRGFHTMGVYCPGGEWESEQCRKKLYCTERIIRSNSDACEQVWRAATRIP
jgi:hypothetical protein